MHVILGEIFALLYLVVPVIGVSGYFPQAFKLIQAREFPQHISLLTWWLWAGTWFIGFGYAVFTVKAGLLAITAAINVAGHLLVIGLTIYKRGKY